MKALIGNYFQIFYLENYELFSHNALYIVASIESLLSESKKM